MTAICIWVILAIACGVISHYKGRRTWLWVILGVIGGVFSLLVIVCLPSVKKCPACANEVNKEAIICYHCGYDFLKKKTLDRN